MAFCKYCGQFLDSEAAFCPKCGKEAVSEKQMTGSVRCEDCGTVYDAKKSSCPKCFSKNRDEVQSAPSRLLNQRNLGTNTQTASEPKVNPVVAGIVICLALVISVGAVIVNTNNSKKNAPSKSVTTAAPNKSGKTATSRSLSTEDLVWGGAMSAVGDQLLTPASAKYTKQKIVKADDGFYDVYGIVDSQNKFGAVLRKYFYVRIRINNNDTFDHTPPQISDFDLS